MNYIDINTLSAIDKYAVSILKTSNNTMDLMVKNGENDLIIGDTTVKVPIFVSSAVIQQPYQYVDAVQDKSSSELSAFPGPCNMVLSADDNTKFNVSGISINECMIYAISNAIVKKLIDDNKLVNNVDKTKTYRWYVENINNIIVNFNQIEDYPYYYNYKTYSMVASQLVETNNTEKVKLNNGLYHQLEKYYSIPINNNINISTLIGCNILVYNNIDNKKYNINDFYIQNNNILIKLKTDYFEELNKNINFDITLHYIYN